MPLVKKLTGKTKQEIFVEHVCPLSLNVSDLDLWPRNSNFIRGHLLIMTNRHTKLEDPWTMSSIVIDRTSSVVTDGPTSLANRRTDNMCKAIYAIFFEGGYNKWKRHLKKVFVELNKQDVIPTSQGNGVNISAFLISSNFSQFLTFLWKILCYYPKLSICHQTKCFRSFL